MLQRVCKRQLSKELLVKWAGRYLATPEANLEKIQINKGWDYSGQDRRLFLLVAASAIGVTITSSDDGNDEEGGIVLEEEDKEHHIEMALNSQYRKTKMYKHFCSFATQKYNGDIFMTATDFFNAVHTTTGDSVEFSVLDEEDFQDIISSTPHHSSNELGFLKNLGDKAIISYPEYLFLVSLINTPKAMFLNTFKIIDTDGNLQLDLSEFEKLEAIYSKGIADHCSVNSSLKTHFFGTDGKGVIAYLEFVDFIDGLQKDCLQTEFESVSGGSDEVSGVDFTRLLLSRTSLGGYERTQYLNRVEGQGGKGNSVTFQQYSQFMHLLNGIKDLEVALRMYQIAKESVSRDEFKRAVRIATGHELDDTMVDLTFMIFDDNNDGKLSHSEFIKVVKDRRRKLGTVETQLPTNPWNALVRCVQHRRKSD